MIQKIFRNGNSAVTTIPKDFLRKLNLKIGKKVELEYYPNSQVITITPVGKKNKEAITPDFLKAFENVLIEHGPALKELAKR